MSTLAAHNYCRRRQYMLGFTLHNVAHRDILSPATIYAATVVCLWGWGWGGGRQTDRQTEIDRDTQRDRQGRFSVIVFLTI